MARRTPKSLLHSVLRRTGFDLVRAHSPLTEFHSDHYLRHNARRLEHLASLRIPVSGLTVLEVGAGIGDHSHYYIDRGCEVTITEVRQENLRYLENRFPTATIRYLDMEHPRPIAGAPFDVLHCYGLLYHLSNPAEALRFLRTCCKGMLLLETSVSPECGAPEPILVRELQRNPTQAASGRGSRPTRQWVFDELTSLFDHVYVPLTQPNHEEFPLDWTAPQVKGHGITRAVFVASLTSIENDQLVPFLPPQQTRQP
jgi:ubiquinone/menaquinone biosynthesis C-methylase UbiE